MILQAGNMLLVCAYYCVCFLLLSGKLGSLNLRFVICNQFTICNQYATTLFYKKCNSCDSCVGFTASGT